MKKIFIRSPYYIQVAETGQAGSKIEVFLWTDDSGVPSTPTYTLTKEIPSPSQIDTSYNISNLAKDFINAKYPTYTALPDYEDRSIWCWMKVKRYKLSGDVYVLLDEEWFACLNGYSTYKQGYNYSLTSTVLPLFNDSLTCKVYSANVYFDIFIEPSDTYETIVKYYNAANALISTQEIVEVDGNESMYKVPLIANSVRMSIEQNEPLFDIFTEWVCEPKYTPKTVAFINRYGGWQFLTFFKASKESIDVTSTKFDLMPEDLNYNIKIGQTRTLNHNGKQKIRMNTGFVQESYFELMQDLLLSEVVLIDNKPATVKTNSLDYKKRLDGLINYEVEFEYAFNLIQNVR